MTSAHNASVHDATQFTPNFLTYGRELHMPVDVVYGTPATDKFDGPSDFVNYLHARLEEAYTAVRVNCRSRPSDARTNISGQCGTRNSRLGITSGITCPVDVNRDITSGKAYTPARSRSSLGLAQQISAYAPFPVEALSTLSTRTN